MQLERGDYPSTYIKTTTTGINDYIVNINLQDVANVYGDIMHDGALQDSSGSPGTAGQVPVSTVTGWGWSSVSGDNLGNHTATEDLNMDTFAINNARSVTGSDLLLVATDSMRLEGDNSFWELNTGFTRLNVAGTNVLAWNNTDRTFSQNIPDNIVAAYNLGSTDGNTFIQVTTTNTAPRMIIGSNESGAAIGLQGIQYEEVQAIVASGSFTATKSTISVDLASTGTVNANLTGWPTATTVASLLTVINVDAVVSVTVDVTGATWAGGASPVLLPGTSVNAKLLNGILYIQ
jgi:hypothetical protein